MMKNNEIGYWMKDAHGLPCFNYVGKIPYAAALPDGTQVKLPNDPWFLLGNYQLTLFTHISGEYELITGQRAWGRVNQGDRRNSGANRSLLEIIDNGITKRVIQLTGLDSPSSDPDLCTRIFGCGFADYTYNVNHISINKNLSVKPSNKPSDGTSAFLLTVTICNNNQDKMDLTYTEAVTANYEEMQFQKQPPECKKVKYRNEISYDHANHLVIVHIQSQTNDPLLFPTRKSMSKYEGYPPSLFIKSMSNDTVMSDEDDEIKAKCVFSLHPGEKKVIQMIIGYTFEHEVSSIENICDKFAVGDEKRAVFLENAMGSFFADEWLKVIPLFENESNDKLKQEMRWHAYNLEAMATYSEYYQETKIPQGTIYDFDWGVHASARDNFQHALPLVYYNPELARSVLRYMCKRTTLFGEIRLVETGYGYSSNERYFTSDQQLFFFFLITEYLRVTGDYGFLAEQVEYFPLVHHSTASVLDFIEKCFIFLRDEIGTGAHGLVKLLNSDWNDAVYYIVNAPYNNILFTGESHMNSAMAISILQNLIAELNYAKSSPKTERLREQLENLGKSLTIYRSSILEAFMKDVGDRSFPRRMYFNGKSYGDDNMFLEPQGYTLMINELSCEYKKNLYNEMLDRVYPNEKLGAREQQTPEFEDTHFDKGSRENGGFWWALNGPVIMGVSQFDPTEAWRLLNNMTFDNYSKAFPLYWTSYWSSADNVESALIPEEGLPDQSLNYSNIPVYCAHPHAWLLYCYYYLLGKN